MNTKKEPLLLPPPQRLHMRDEWTELLLSDDTHTRFFYPIAEHFIVGGREPGQSVIQTIINGELAIRAEKAKLGVRFLPRQVEHRVARRLRRRLLHSLR